MQKPETKFRAKLRARLELVPNSFWESIQQKTIQGTPDIIGCVNGFFVALELKATPSASASALQLLKLKRICNAGGVGYLVHPENMENTLELINHLGGQND